MGIKQIPIDFEQSANVINSMHSLYDNIHFPDYVISNSMFDDSYIPSPTATVTAAVDNGHHHYKNIQDVHRLFRDKKEIKSEQNSNENAFPYNEKYMPPQKEVSDANKPNASSSNSRFVVVLIFILAIMAGIGYYAKTIFFDKSKTS